MPSNIKTCCLLKLVPGAEVLVDPTPRMLPGPPLPTTLFGPEALAVRAVEGTSDPASETLDDAQ